jgi:hypothetical protein
MPNETMGEAAHLALASFYKCDGDILPVFGISYLRAIRFRAKLETLDAFKLGYGLLPRCYLH